MYRARFVFDADTTPDEVPSRIGGGCRTAGLAAHDAEAVLSQARDALQALAESGAAVASSGGQYHARREVVTGAAAVTLVARYGTPPGLFARLRKAITGRS